MNGGGYTKFTWLKLRPDLVRGLHQKCILWGVNLPREPKISNCKLLGWKLVQKLSKYQIGGTFMCGVYEKRLSTLKILGWDGFIV